MENWHKARTKSALVSHVVSSAAAKNQSDALKFVFSFEMFSNELLDDDDDDDGFAALPYEDPVNLVVHPFPSTLGSKVLELSRMSCQPYLLSMLLHCRLSKR